MARSRQGAALLVVLWALDLPAGCGLNPRPEDPGLNATGGPSADAGVPNVSSGGGTGFATGGATGAGGSSAGVGGVGEQTGSGGSIAADASAGGGRSGAGGTAASGGAPATGGVPSDAGTIDGGDAGISPPIEDGATHGDAGDAR